MRGRSEGSDQAPALLSLGGEEAVSEERLAGHLGPPSLLDVHLQLLLSHPAQHPGLRDTQQAEQESAGREMMTPKKYKLFSCQRGRGQGPLGTGHQRNSRSVSSDDGERGMRRQAQLSHSTPQVRGQH